MRELIDEMVQELETYAERHGFTLDKITERKIHDVKYHCWQLKNAAKLMDDEDEVEFLAINTNLTYKLARELQIYYAANARDDDMYSQQTDQY